MTMEKEKRMKLEILIYGLSVNCGGIESYLFRIWNNIDHEHFHFNFIDMTGEGNRPCFYNELISSGATFYKITPRCKSIRKNKEDIRKLFSDHHFDIFHFNVNTLSYIYPVEIAINSGCKVLVHSRSSNTHMNSLTMWFHMLNKIKLSYFGVKRIAVSEAAGKWLFGKSSFDIYYNGVETRKFKYIEDERLSIRMDMDCSDSIVIGHVGAFLPVKNHSFMIDVFQEVMKLDHRAQLWFVGDGPLRNEMSQRVEQSGLEKHIKFLGKRSDLPKLYAGMDLLWLPSEYEGYPNVVMEAFCSGLPCLVSEGVPKDVLIGERYASLRLTDSHCSWAKQLLTLAKENYIDREKSYAYMEQKGASAEVEVKRLEQLYDSLMA